MKGSEPSQAYGFTKKQTLAVLTLAASAILGVSIYTLRTDTQANCISVDVELQLCALSDMSKLSATQEPTQEHPNYAISTSPLQLHAARNETVAYQWLIRGKKRAGLSVELSDFTNANQTAEPAPQASQYIAHYHHVMNGGYTWGPESSTKVLPWPGHYPDALVPQQHTCSGKTLYTGIPEESLVGNNSTIWQDVYVPSDAEAGLYTATARLMRGESELAAIPVELQVWPSTLPEQNSIDAIGEIYRSYRVEGAGEKPFTPEWKRMSNCYQQLAHAHRSTFLERSPLTPETDAEWQEYAEHYGPMLDGSLFTPENGYNGTGVRQAVSLWRTPWLQPYNVKLDGPLPDKDVQQYKTKAEQWSALAANNGWKDVRWFAYVFDEIDGPIHKDQNYIAMTHQQMGLVQEAIDAGSTEKPIDLLWTSHSNPSVWAEGSAQDLRGKVRLWAPNAHAADPEFIAEQKAKGDRSWFYHSGPPSVGAHSVNASGVELRTWGVIAARYQVDGILMWAVNLGNDDKPFADPSYKPDDDRFGNGVLVYPGNALPKIGYEAAPGAIPSFRLKSWRRGLQDFELAQLAAQKAPEETQALLQRMVPRALADGRGKAAWSRDTENWVDFKMQLLQLASDQPPAQQGASIN